MVGGKNIAAVFLHRGNQASDFLPDGLFVVPENGVDPSVENQVGTKTLLQLFRLHTGLNLQRVESVHTNFHQLRHKGHDVAAGVQMGLDAPGMRPFHSAFVDRL